jgi:hypothetical protein
VFGWWGGSRTPEEALVCVLETLQIRDWDLRGRVSKVIFSKLAV